MLDSDDSEFGIAKRQAELDAAQARLNTDRDQLARFTAFRDKYGTGRRSAFGIIEHCCDEIVAQGIRVVRGAAFNWTGSNLNEPLACNALGAVLWCAGAVNVAERKSELRHPNPWSTLCTLLGVDAFWLYRFTIGWDQQTQLIVYYEGPNKTLIPRDDEISRQAMKISKERTR